LSPGKLRLGLVQMSMADDKESNVNRALELAAEASGRGANVICFPELFATRYFPAARGSKTKPENIPGPTSRALSRCAKDLGVVLVGGTIFEGSGGKMYNTCLVFGEDGRTLSKYRKVHIPQDEHYYEQDYFSPGRGYSVARTERGVLGSLICFDQWYPEPARIARLLGAEVLFYPTAIGWVKGIEPVEGDWKRAWEQVMIGHAISNSMVVCAVNRVGTEGDTSFWGGSFVCDQFGKVLCRMGEEEGTRVVSCNLELGRVVEEGWGFMRNRQKGTYARLAK
jgi:predicted amidohydrolase